MAPKNSGERRWWGFSFASSSRRSPTVITISSDTEEIDPSENTPAAGLATSLHEPEITSRPVVEPRRASAYGTRPVIEPRRASVHEGRPSGSVGASYEGVHGVANQVVGTRSLAEMRRSASVGGSRGDRFRVSNPVSEPRRASISEKICGVTFGGVRFFNPGQTCSSRHRRTPSPEVPVTQSVINISSDSSYCQFGQPENAYGQHNNNMMPPHPPSGTYHYSESIGTSDSSDSFHTTA